MNGECATGHAARGACSAMSVGGCHSQRLQAEGGDAHGLPLSRSLPCPLRGTPPLPTHPLARCYLHTVQRVAGSGLRVIFFLGVWGLPYTQSAAWWHCPWSDLYARTDCRNHPDPLSRLPTRCVTAPRPHTASQRPAREIGSTKAMTSPSRRTTRVCPPRVEAT